MNKDIDDKLIIRPSSLDTYLQCAHQWYRVFIGGGTSIPSSRAAIGTAIHAGVEEMWNDSIMAKTKVVAKSTMEDAAVEAFELEVEKGMELDDNETTSSCVSEIRTGLGTYVEDVLPWVDIPTAVEQRYTVAIDNHPIIGAVSGTLDYVDTKRGVISDLKTGKRKHNVANSETQQTIYRYLVEENGIKVNHSTIQAVVLKAKPEGHVMDARINMPKAKAIVNSLLDVLEVYNEDVVDPNILFRGNPKYYLCSPKYCAFYGDCRYVGN